MPGKRGPPADPSTLECKICRFTAEDKYGVILHMNNTHDASRVFCVFCTSEIKTFHRPDALRNHALGCHKPSSSQQAKHPDLPKELFNQGLCHVYAAKPTLWPNCKSVKSGKMFQMAIKAKQTWYQTIGKNYQEEVDQNNNESLGAAEEDIDYVVEDIIVDLGEFDNDEKLLRSDSVVCVEPLESRLTRVLKHVNLPITANFTVTVPAMSGKSSKRRKTSYY